MQPGSPRTDGSSGSIRVGTVAEVRLLAGRDGGWIGADLAEAAVVAHAVRHSSGALRIVRGEDPHPNRRAQDVVLLEHGALRESGVLVDFDELFARIGDDPDAVVVGHDAVRIVREQHAIDARVDTQRGDVVLVVLEHDLIGGADRGVAAEVDADLMIDGRVQRIGPRAERVGNVEGIARTELQERVARVVAEHGEGAVERRRNRARRHC